MGTEIRHITPEERRAFAENVAYVFAVPRALADAYVEKAESWVTPEWTMTAVVDGVLASTLGAWPLHVRIDGRAVEAAGVTSVGTRPEYRRQGLQRRVMERALAWHHECGQAFAVLWASHGAIYQRYGYGLASANTSYAFSPREVALREERESELTVRRVDWREPAIREMVARTYAAYVAPRNLQLEREDWRWRQRWQWEFEEKTGESIYLAIASDGSGVPRGYVAYRTEEHLTPHEPGANQVMSTSDFVAPDVETWRALWGYIARHDLVREVRMAMMPEDDPASDLLLEPRALRRRTSDGVWMRLIDVARALEGRGYGEDVAGSVVIGVRDELCGWNDGTYRVTVDVGHAAVTRVQEAPDLAMPIGALASLYSGFRSATELARAGRVEGDARALRAADRLFATAYRPHVMEDF